MENIKNSKPTTLENETKDLEAEFEEAKRNYTSKFESRKITNDFELVYIRNSDGSISPQIRKVER